ncbi:MAG: hypothetical protein QM743_11405 [Chitinophagaceae bacterium]
MDNTSKDPDQIVYVKSRKLDWDDFQGEEERNADAVAMAYTGVSVRYEGSIRNGEVHLDIRVYAHFSKRQSWVLPQSKTDWTLAHEQRHFDITALNACALFEELKHFSFTNRFEEEIHSLQERYQKKNEDEQDEYDRRTNHGIYHESQREWNERIIKMLGEQADCFR